MNQTIVFIILTMPSWHTRSKDMWLQISVNTGTSRISEKSMIEREDNTSVTFNVAMNKANR